MQHFALRPTLKRVKLAYAACAVLFLLGLYIYSQFLWHYPAWVALLPLLAFLWPILEQFRSRKEKLVLKNGILKYSTGMFSRDALSQPVGSVVDVVVEQKAMQKLIGVGNLTVKLSGGAEDIVMGDIDNPRKFASMILAARDNAEHLVKDGTEA
jgi:hypothetical protein